MMPAMVAAIGLGSSLGDRRAHLRRGLVGLSTAGCRLLALSSLWESEPVGSRSGLWFLNMAALARVELTPRALLERLLAIEEREGRSRTARNAPRTLDLDLLDLDGIELHEEGLELPHPRMWQRRFVLAPLAEIAPGMIRRTTGRSVAEELAELRDPAIVVRLEQLDFDGEEAREATAIIRRGSLRG